MRWPNAQAKMRTCSGEIVIVVKGADAERNATELDAERLLRALLEELSPAQAAKIAARLTGGKRGDFYDRALVLSGKSS
jgi:16S rRNA (cytidine1402-2'-O)-methyltransferase